MSHAQHGLEPQKHDDNDALVHALQHAAHLLPDQGPIGVFVHHNTLHAFQQESFHDAVVAGAALVGAEPYLTADALREAWRRGRIADVDVDVALASLPTTTDAPLPLGLSVRTLRRALLADALDDDDGAGLAFSLARGTLPLATNRTRWQACTAVVARAAARAARAGTSTTKTLRRHRDVLVALGHDDPDVPLHAELQRLAAAFLDLGQALAVFPRRGRGFLHAVGALHEAGSPGPRFAPGAAKALAALKDANAHDVVRAELAALGVDDVEPFVTATLLALPGWAGMFSRLERHPDDLLPRRVPAGAHNGSHGDAHSEVHGDAHGDDDDEQPRARLVDFLAVRLVLERHALTRACGKGGLPLSWRSLSTTTLPTTAQSTIVAVHLLCGLAAAAGAGADAVSALSDDDVSRLFDAVADFDDRQRRRVLHEAYEGFYRRQILDALAAHRAEGLDARSPSSPSRPSTAAARAQFVFCIDEREESMRRALEEQGPHVQTFGVAGFFGMAIDYQGIDDDHPAAYCPVVVTPAHEVREAPVDVAAVASAARARLRERWRGVQRSLAAASRGLLGGAALSLLGGPVAGAATVGRVVAPRRSLGLRARVGEALLSSPPTQLLAARAGDDDDARNPRGRWRGFTVQESADRVHAVLSNIGLTSDFGPIVVVIGHGSTSLNNPHESAHDCGACGGRRGGANARLFAATANRADVRAALRARGLSIPDDTWFVGALHDTSDDGVRLFDVDAVPPSLRAAFVDVQAALERARRDNAAERARRFDDAPPGIAPERALRHVQGRAAHLAQPRPEYGHCTNAIAIVGRRALSRGLHLDRRAFLVSYDPLQDKGDAVLERILAAVGPVGAGINLEYYFSAVDNERFGCGTKLPHNVVGLLGVMNGHGSDLRTGLPLQMVELHEPMRLLLIVDASPEALLGIAGRQAEVRELVVNEWIQLVSVHPTTGAMAVFEHGGFVPYRPGAVVLPRVSRSADWHAQARVHLLPARVEAGHG